MTGGGNKKNRISPARIILLSMFITIILGTILLSLPISRNTPIPLIDLLFTSASAACVTGLLTVPLSSFTQFGQCIIMILLQIGGLGVITLTLFVMYLITNLGLSSQILAGHVLELNAWKNIKKLLIFIITLTLSIETIGSFLFFLTIKNKFHLSRAIFLSIFHSISSFCNAGFSLLNLTNYSNNYLFLLTAIFLILSGGLGFLTWHELIQYLLSFKKKKFFHFSLSCKIIFSITFTLVIITTCLYYLLEYNNAFINMDNKIKLLNAFFNAVASRSSGFSTIQLPHLQLPSIFIIMLTAFIGSSPGSTGSGIKITTFAIFLASIKSALYGRSSVEIRKRQIAKEQINKAVAIVSLSLIWLVILIFLLLVIEKGFNFLDICLEAIASFANLGLSSGITKFLSLMGKILLIISMIIGRIGSLTLILALKRKTESIEYSYPEEKVVLS